MSQTIERVFADAKELHGMRYTQYRRLAKVKMELTLKFACMNLKKLAMWKFEEDFLNTNFYKNNSKFIKKNGYQILLFDSHLSTT